MTDHPTKIVRHHIGSCNTAKHAAGGDCGTRFEMRCVCGFMQGAGCREHAEAIERGHIASPGAPVIPWDSKPITANSITTQDLRDLFARHCECRPLDLQRTSADHAAIHDCDTGILHDVRVALGLVVFNDIGRIQAIQDAKRRCAEYIMDARQEGR